ncbi:MAG: hypothetical protein L6427_07565, partial [Actinomycetia bacterium]|nr:hypothetical protein [Actinomycetes bacterium]
LIGVGLDVMRLFSFFHADWAVANFTQQPFCYNPLLVFQGALPVVILYHTRRTERPACILHPKEGVLGGRKR